MISSENAFDRTLNFARIGQVPMKLRLDKTIVERGLAPSRTDAQRKIAAGEITVDGTIVARPGFPVDDGQIVQCASGPEQYVSRGGRKLAAALDAWKIDATGRICLDVGTSTGGFADCLLQRGAAWVTGIDAGHGQLAASLASHPRLGLLERTNARYLTAAMLPVAGTSFLAVDVSFIAASLVLSAVINAAFPPDAGRRNATPREAVVLVKPQFEAGREFVGKRGIVRSEVAHRVAIDRVRTSVRALGAIETGVMDSPIEGGGGNREFLLYARF